jgi:hypothetical protein
MSLSQSIERPPTPGSEANAVRVAVVDGHESLRLGLKAAFSHERYDVILVASTVDEVEMWLEIPRVPAD